MVTKPIILSFTIKLTPCHQETGSNQVVLRECKVWGQVNQMYHLCVYVGGGGGGSTKAHWTLPTSKSSSLVRCTSSKSTFNFSTSSFSKASLFSLSITSRKYSSPSNFIPLFLRADTTASISSIFSVDLYWISSCSSEQVVNKETTTLSSNKQQNTHCQTSTKQCLLAHLPL